ncbi:flavodoxin-dependent (E)-4-hydroxy-3-methylbut-2-enyl-diphosphate synthase [Candidatus Vesicomyidisocius calyptogenae]|uniref:4-hydroxy-3-methylbut-2-en-1-yl diphosphate synthase (flavodoxin) n=1 Tax=Vesicomyosocius okutanii subsp. Calyptogena okutanii (strain HA) TaxID=412965 RepID=ISPG_VESOH|nr:flavodoxin-dependent (E)-4-hydroxy-3-methylbut-2-enyl-diphosphate synthase [Candidatus Vesicomyosocius okutanii]A5CX35.1 RecName: Full=4-hydroxy-3-methylbut-2-en-1-yl diphosphate synthase (flavodoxin); AltName: Full=1-hydroxy-2-methyl-2-(E)-butenyl 4-diphosphate synthase [Candidatus Vesicomyosocius okutanii]BAF61483.1 4-hydroxy-3-methylbut-2-en-1-yl diphosphate synthase [Candidatus Vesicomyosocius okutanii]
MKPIHTIHRRESKQIFVGNVAIGGDAPISVQSMTNTKTTDVKATLKQISEIEEAGADLVRVSIPTMEAARAFKVIKEQVTIPLIADIHFDYKIALEVAKYGADCLRINPGNIGRVDYISEVVASAKDHDIPIRIGVNAGSLEKYLQKKYTRPTPEAMVESALRHIDILDKLNFDNFKISLKASEIFMTVFAYQQLSSQIDNPLHLGITEAGSLSFGTVKSSIGLGLLLSKGIGDTIRVSLASDPVDEVRVAFNILKSLNLRQKGVNLIACPSCSRQKFDVIKVVSELESRFKDIITPIDVSVIGCVVNGPGEAKSVSVGLTGGDPNLLYLDGKTHSKIINENLVNELEAQVRNSLKNL